MPTLTVELLGGLRVTAGDGRELRIASRKAQALLACLALRLGTPLARDHLATLLWDDSDPDLARASLRQALAALRRALPAGAASALVADMQTLALDATLAASDVQRFHELARDGSPSALAEAAEHHAGELLQGFDARSAAFDAWIDEQRRALRVEWSRALQRAAEHCRAAGDLAGATAFLTRLVAAEPSSEAAHRDLMELYARRGLYTEALRQYRSCSQALRRDLDVAPDPATEALYRDILRRRRALVPDADDGTELDADRGPGSVAPADRPANVATMRDVAVLVARIGRDEGARHANDPEALRDDWARAEVRVREVAGAQGGVADRPGQGEIVVAFGLASATGNEVERALRTARQLAEPRPDGPPLAIGVARGLVLPAAAADPFPVAGQPVTVARELARAASLGSVLVAPEVSAQVQDPHAPAGFAGRRAELAMLETLFERAASSGRGRAVVVRGDPGIGKSSLLEALAAAARPKASVFVANVLDFGQRAAERPLATLAAQWLGLSPAAGDGDRAAAIDAALESGVLETQDRRPAADLLALEPSGPQATDRAALDATARDHARARVLRRLLTRVAAGRPALVLVEDVHWADADEVAQLGELAGAVATLPVLLTFSTRSDGDPFSAAWRARARGCPVTLLDLAPLADDEARELAAAHAALPDEVLERCLETAAGNPLFLVQLLRSAAAGQTSLPGSIRALLLARVERLPAASQRLLHAAATLGTRFGIEALRHVAAAPVEAGADVEAPGLLACDGDDCRFTHALVRAAVYESLLRSTRRTLHQRAAVWYETRDPGLYAEHLAAAEDPAAAAAHLRAARLEQRAHRYDRALQHAERAAALAGSDVEHCEANAVLGDVHLARGRTEAALSAYQSSTGLAATPGARARARLGAATALRILDRYDEALEVLQAAERDATDEGEPRRLARVWTLRGNLYFPRGEMERCLRAHERALELAQEACSVEDIAEALGGLGDAQYQRGHMCTALNHIQRALELSERHELAGLRLAYLPMAAAIHNFCGHFDRALALADEGAAAAHRAGNLRAELIAHSVAGSTGIYRADYPSALTRSEQAIELARELGARRFESEGLVIRGLARHGLGDLAGGRRAIETAIERARESAPTYCGAWALAALASISGDESIGRACLEEGARLLERGSVSHNHLEYHMYAIEFLLGVHDLPAVTRHAAALADYTREDPLPWSDLVVARAEVLVATGSGRRRRGTTERLRGVLAETERMGFELLAPRLRAALARLT